MRQAICVELPLTDQVRGLDPIERGGRRVELFETEHPPHEAFDKPMILLKDIVQIFVL